MARVNDYICDRCGRACSTVVVHGKLIPLVIYIVAGTPPDYPGPVDLNAPGVKVPELIRDLMAQPVARREWCVDCFAKEFGLELRESLPAATA